MRITLALALLLGACSSGTAPGTQILLADVANTDVPPDVRRTLVGVIEHEQEARFPDGEGIVLFEISHGRGADTSHGDIRVPGADARLYLRSIRVEVVDSAGYDLSASVFGNPTNSGTAEAPIHTRLVQIARTRSGLTGTSSATMTVRVTPTSADVI